MKNKDLLFGRTAEALVADYLREQGLVILEQNYRVGHLELDLIAKDQSVLVFIEVKARTGHVEICDLPDLIKQDKQQRLIRAADAYCRICPHPYEECRFDYAFVLKRDGQLDIHHIPNAIIPSVR